MQLTLTHLPVCSGALPYNMLLPDTAQISSLHISIHFLIRIPILVLDHDTLQLGGLRAKMEEVKRTEIFSFCR